MKLLPWVVASLVLATLPGQTGGDVAALEQAVQDAIKKAEPSIACILVSRSDQYKQFERGRPAAAPPGWLGDFPRVRVRDEREPDDPRQKLDMSSPDYVPESYGSGVVLDSVGLILTNAHVVRGAVKVFVRLPGGVESYADIHALDGRSDLAVLRLINKPPAEKLKPLAIGDGDAVKKGQFIVTLSNPFAAGFRDGSPSASSGIISNLRRRAVRIPGEKDRRQLCLHHFATLLQTDARVRAGCSGGAVLNLKGELIGMTTAQAALTGVDTPGGFALPMDARVRRIIEVLVRGEEVEYGFMGVSFADESGGGVRLAEVIGQSPARHAGLKNGDYLVRINGAPVQNSDDVLLHVGMMLAGNSVEIERSRGPGQAPDRVTVKLAKYYHQQPSLASKRPGAVGGLRVDYSSLAVQRGPFNFQSIPEGVLIREVEAGSAADKARLQPDKIISHVNDRKVVTPAQFYEAAERAGNKLVLRVLRGEGGFDEIILRPE